MMEDLAGRRFGSLIVIRRVGTRYDHQPVWLCICDCGNETNLVAFKLKRGHTKSCGCKHHGGTTGNFRHGLTRRGQKRSPEIQMWYNAKARAQSENLPFNIEIADIVIPERCPVLNIPLFVGDRRNHWNAPSIDKIIRSAGYVKGNIRVISHRANVIRTNATVEELRKVADYAERAEAEALQCVATL